MEDLIAPVRPQFGEDIYRTLLLEKFLLAVARKLHDCKTDETAEIETRDRTIMDTITYISAHYLESIHLDDIATHLCQQIPSLQDFQGSYGDFHWRLYDNAPSAKSLCPLERKYHDGTGCSSCGRI